MKYCIKTSLCEKKGKRKKKMVKKSKTRDRVSKDEEEEIDSQEEEESSSSSKPKERSLYEVLGVERTSTQQEIKRAYYKLALRLHPDKNPGDEEAKEKFQQLQKVMSILGNEDKRALYDQTGCVDDVDLAGEDVKNLYEYFRTVYKRVTEADIEEFEANYRGSASEKSDLKKLYKKYKGDMNRIFCFVLCSDPALDSHRFMDILNETIAEGELKETKAFKQWAKEVSKTKPPSNPLKKRSKSNKQEESDLVALISQRNNQRKEQFESMFTSIAAKCNTGKSVQSGPEPSEEEFEAARRRLESGKQTKKGKKK